MKTHLSPHDKVFHELGSLVILSTECLATPSSLWSNVPEFNTTIKRIGWFTDHMIGCVFYSDGLYTGIVTGITVGYVFSIDLCECAT